MSERDWRPSREQVWLSVGAIVGVMLAGVLVTVLLVTGNQSSPAQLPASSPSSTAVTTTSEGGQVATARDASLKAAEEAAVVLNTLDYHNADRGLTQWESVATSPLLDELKGKHAQNVDDVEKARTTSTAKVLAAAVSRVAADASSADVLVSVEVTVADSKGASTVKLLREKITMTSIGDGWKVSAIAMIEPAG
jgi:Mce-associated membrane protein